MTDWKQIDRHIQKLKKSIMKNAADAVRKIRQEGFHFLPFSKKQMQILTWWTDGSPVKEYDGIIADGAIRSGKTLSMSLSYVFWSMEKFKGQNFIMAGKTIGSFRRNVLFWLKLMLRSRGYEVSDHRNENMVIIRKKDVLNYYYIFGGKDERSQDLVQGITAAGAFFDEVALMPESFVNQATGRCSVEGSKFWFNCNPDSPVHWFKIKWIDKTCYGMSAEQIEKCLDAGTDLKKLIYLHFTMDDNLSLSEDIKNRYKSLYVGVFYLRYILGLWSVAEGLIYTAFTDENLYDDADMPVALKSTGSRTISVDYGTHNPCVFLDIWDDGQVIWVDNEYRWDSQSDIARRSKNPQKTDSQYADDMEQFMGTREDQMCPIVADPSAASFITELRLRGFVVRPGNNEVEDGIRVVSAMFANNLIRIHRTRCGGLIAELRSYVWDDKAAEHGEDKPVKQKDHGPDALRYYCYTIIPKWRTGRR